MLLHGGFVVGLQNTTKWTSLFLEKGPIFAYRYVFMNIQIHFCMEVCCGGVAEHNKMETVSFWKRVLFLQDPFAKEPCMKRAL